MLTESVHLRLSAAEKEAVKRLAAAERRTISNWIRALILTELQAEFNRKRASRGKDGTDRPSNTEGADRR